MYWWTKQTSKSLPPNGVISSFHLVDAFPKPRGSQTIKAFVEGEVSSSKFSGAMRGQQWTRDEQKHLVQACSRALSVVPGASPPLNWPKKLQISISNHFRGYFTRQRTSKALVEQVYVLCKMFKEVQALERASSTNPRRDGGQDCCHPRLDSEVFAALHKLHQDYPGSIVTGPQKEKRARLSWTLSEMETLARAMKACAGEAPSAFEDAYYRKFLELGGKERTVDSVRAEANSLLLIRNYMLNELGSWQAWLQMSEREREEHPTGLKATYKRALRNMNRNIFVALDELAEAQRASGRNRDGTPPAGASDQNARGTRERAGVAVARGENEENVNQVNPVNEQEAREQTPSQSRTEGQGRHELPAHEGTPVVQILQDALRRQLPMVAGSQALGAELFQRQFKHWEGASLKQATRTHQDERSAAHSTALLSKGMEVLTGRLNLVQRQMRDMEELKEKLASHTGADVEM